MQLSLVSFVCLFVLNIFNATPAPQFRFGNTQGDYMVLQQEPYRAQIWGFSTPNDIITLTLSYQSNSKVIDTVTTKTNGSNSTWKTYLSPQPAQNDVEYIITAKSSSSGKIISISHILYGDVFWCSGQSNMGFCVISAFNGTSEAEASNNFPNIRVFKVHPSSSNETNPNIESHIYVPWSKPNSSIIGNGNWTYYSATCWFFGRYLYQHLNYPIGLMEGDCGGNPIRAFMPNEARTLCNETTANCAVVNKTINASDDINNFANYDKLDDTYDSGFFYGFIYPILQTTIRGAIWYQGERDSKEECANLYSCAMPALINSWRKYWSLMSDTNETFPFGLVQISTYNDNTQNETCSSITQNDTLYCTDAAIVRWGQTANYGYVPNDKMKNTFMIGTIDLGDPNSPWGDVHPRYKVPVGKRLVLGARNIIYGEKNIYFNGPIAEKFTIDINNKIGIIQFRNVDTMGLQIKNYQGFEFYNGKWMTQMNTTFVANGNNTILIPLENNLVNTVEMVRFLWFHATCHPNLGPYNCPIYDKQYQLPAMPFIMNVTKP
eukprot:427386_1